MKENKYNLNSSFKMPLQKKKHPRYRKKLTEKEKKQIKRIVKLKEKQNLQEILYSLPLDVKKKIYKMTIHSNMKEWFLKHQKEMRTTISFLGNPGKGYKGEKIELARNGNMGYIGVRYSDDTYNENDLNMLYDGREDIYLRAFFKKSTLCKKAVKRKGQPGIKDVFLDPMITSGGLSIHNRMWSNIKDRFWYHENCRCQFCDSVRIHGFHDLPMNQKKKFDRIQWNDQSMYQTQWNTKSLKQVKYEKEKERREYRNSMKLVKGHSLIVNHL